MMSYGQNEELTIEALSPLVEENAFLQQIPDTRELPSFESAKELLPKPVWEGHDSHIATYWHAWEIAFGNLRKPAPGTGFVSPFIDTAFNGCTFMWDSAFMLMFGKYGRRVFHFQGTLDNFYSHQHRDGFICREIEEDTGREHFTRHDPSATGPEVLPWCEWVYYQNTGDMKRLSQVFPPLLAYHRWMRLHHTWPDGSYFSSGWGCGMDNCPRLMPEYDQRKSHGHMVWVDACLQAAFSCQMLMQMAEVLNRPEFLPELQAEYDSLNGLIQGKLWDEDTGFFYDLWKTGQRSPVRHIGAYWALLSGCATAEQAERMVALLEDETAFKTPHRIPTLSRDHPEFVEDGRYWRGGVWASTNYMVLRGLTKYGYHPLAHQIAKNHLDTVVEVYEKERTLFECYAPMYPGASTTAKGNPVRRDFVGWTGLPPIAMLFEYVFGIQPDVPENTIHWHIRLTDAHGVERYPFGRDGLMTLHCEKRNSADDTPRVTVTSNVPVTLELTWGSENNRKTQLLDIAERR